MSRVICSIIHFRCGLWILPGEGGGREKGVGGKAGGRRGTAGKGQGVGVGGRAGRDAAGGRAEGGVGEVGVATRRGDDGWSGYGGEGEGCRRSERAVLESETSQQRPD